MGLSSGGIAQFSAGAGRTAMIMFPSLADAQNNGAALSTNLTGRGGMSAVSQGVTSSVAATGTLGFQSFDIPTATLIAGDALKGQAMIRLLNAAAGDSAKIAFNNAFFGEMQPLAAGVQPDRFFRVLRFIMRGYFPVLAGAINQTTTDCGICIVPGNVATMNGGANRPGIQFGPTDVNKYTLRTRKGFAAGYDFTQDFTVAQLGFDPTVSVASYEIRIISADNTGAAKVKVFANEVQIGPTFVVSAADGRVPGSSAAGGGFNGHSMHLINSNMGNYSWYAKYMAYILSPDELGNL